MTVSQDTPRHTCLADARQTRINRPEVAAACERTRLRELGEAVRLRREELGWSQRQLAERAGMSQPSVGRFEAGGTNPTLPLLERLAQALGLTAEWLGAEDQARLIAWYLGFRSVPLTWSRLSESNRRPVHYE